MLVKLYNYKLLTHQINLFTRKRYFSKVFYLLQFLIKIMLTSSCSTIPASTTLNDNLDSVYCVWNNLTIQSLNRQLVSVKDSSRRTWYESRIKVLSECSEYKGMLSLIPQTSRYDFLKSFLNRLSKKTDCLIFERRTSGEMVDLKNIVFYKSDSNLKRIEVFTFGHFKWNIEPKILYKDLNFEFDSNLSGNFTTFGKGICQDEIIVSRIVNGKFVESECFLPYTLSANGNIAKVLIF